jgi:hypothetical protein
VYEFLDNLIQKYCNSNTDFNILDYLKTNDIDINDMFGNATDVINCIEEIKDHFLEFTKKVPDEFTRSSLDLSMDSVMTLGKRILQLYTYVWLKDSHENDPDWVEQFFEFEKVVVDDEHVTIRLAPHLETYRQNKLREFGVNSEDNAPEESEDDDEEEKEAERLQLEAMRKLNAIREAKKLAAEKKSMKSKIAEYRAEFIGNPNLAIAGKEGEITKKLAEIENLRTEIGGFKDKIDATNLGMYDDEILARKVEENAPKKNKKIVKKTENKANIKRKKTKHYGKLSWDKMLGSDTLIRYGLLVNREGNNCLYGKATLRLGKDALIYPIDKDGNPSNWACETTGLAGCWGTLSGFVRSVLIKLKAEKRKKGSWDWADARETTPFGEYYDKRDNEWKPLANVLKCDVINA